MTGDWTRAGTVAQLLELRAAETPEAIAFQCEVDGGRWQPITWHNFAARVSRLRHALSAAGLRKGDRLALIAPVSLEWELLHHAALALGVVVVGLDAHDLPERIAEMADQADVVAFATTDPRVLLQVGSERLAKVRFVLQLATGLGDPPTATRRLSWTELEALGESARPGHAPPTADDIATIIFTSGTTGAPKGIAFSHGQVCLAIDAICGAFDFIGNEGRLLCWLPLSNLFQRMVNLAGVRKGVGTYLLDDPRRVMDVVATASPDVFVGVPRFFEKLYDGIREHVAAQSPLRRWLIESAWSVGRRTSRMRLDKRPVPLWLALVHRVADRIVLERVRSVMGHRLRCMVTGSAPMPLPLLEEFHALGWLVLEAYGLSENVLPMAMNRIDDFRLGTVGRPLSGNQIVLADDGAIKVRGAGVFAGYLGEGDSSPLDGDGFYLTGDLGQFDAEGYLRLTGRSGDLIKTSTGRRVWPAGVEALLRSVAGIDDALLIGNGRKYLVALCTCVAGLDEPSRVHLKASLRAQLARIGERERPLGVALLDRQFSIELGELTPNLKLRRSAIEDRHARLIGELYERVDRCASHPAGELVVI